MAMQEYQIEILLDLNGSNVPDTNLTALRIRGVAAELTAAGVTAGMIDGWEVRGLIVDPASGFNVEGPNISALEGDPTRGNALILYDDTMSAGDITAAKAPLDERAP